MKRSASPNPHVLSPVEKRVKPEFHDQATPNAPVVGLQHAGRSAPSVAQALRPHAPFQQDVAPPQFSPTCPPKPRPSSTIFRDTQCEGHQGNYFSPSSSPGHMSPPLRDFIVGSPTRSHFVSPTVHCEYLVSRDNSLSSPSGSLSSHPLISPTFISPTNSNFSVGSAASHLSGTAIAIRTVPTHSLGPASPPPPSSSARKNLQANGYDHNKARCEFQRARAKGESITSNSSPTFAALLNSTLTANKTSSGGPKSQAPPSKKSTMSPSMHHTHSYGSSDVQQPAKTGPIRTSASRGGYPSLTQPGRRFKPPYKSTLTTLSPTVSSSDHNQNYNRSISHDSHYNHSYSARSGSSYNARSGPSYNAGPRKLMSPPHMLSRPSYQPPPLPPAIQLSAYQYPCMHGESSARGSNPQSAADRAIMSLPINPLPTAPTWATEPGSGPLPLPNPPPHPAQPRRPTMSIRPTHSNGLPLPAPQGGKNSRRPSFAALLPGCKTAPPKHSRPGQWTLEKRLIFVDRLLTAGYKSLSLSDLASELELKKKQLVNQLTPGRTGSIRELCMNAAARLHEPCTDCKKKQAISKRKADSEGLADFLLRGVSERIDEDEGELELDDNDGNESLEEEDELPDEDVKKDESQ
ncbi:hypothetical protein CcaverHIS641_0408890 [Cutaneotrichosporon cavernicola]|nr:hypothetical protein CcaverHIS641_0408890 [Cutaneotrichosporon cavernicola]